MPDEKKNEEQEKGFVIKDKRFTAKKEEEKESPKKEKKEEATKEEVPKEEVPLPEINFFNFIFSLSTSVLIQLGAIQDPITQKESKNLPLAKQTIDLLGMLKEKTKGNLTPEEDKLIEDVLFDLQMMYVKAVG